MYLNQLSGGDACHTEGQNGKMMLNEQTELKTTGLKTLRQIISQYIRLLTVILVVLILNIIVYIQVVNEQQQAYDNAMRTFQQIEQMLAGNQEEIEEVITEYSETCLRSAEAIAYIIQNEPSALESVEELKNIARLVGVDEIHFFDKTGRIYAGTHPEYYDFTFDSGEQLAFFKPMLEDHSLKLVQEITPNTAEEKMMQYSALWSENGEFIVQVGMEPVSVMKATAKNELSYLFSQFRVNLEAHYYAVDIASGQIVGSTELDCLGKNLTEIGLDEKYFSEYEKGFHARVNGRTSYCVFQRAGDNYIGRVIAGRDLYKRIPETTAALAVCLAVIAFALSLAVTRYMDRYVVDGIRSINEKLGRIAEGYLDEVIAVNSSAEFAELSSYINIMKQSILDSNRKMSYVLRKTNMYIGVYEYNERVKRVRFTEYIPRILALDEGETKQLCLDAGSFQRFIDEVRKNPVAGEPETFGVRDRYVKLEEIRDHHEVFGVVIDVTESVNKRKEIEAERDMDLLTGLYNRRGLEQRLSALFEKPEELGSSAAVMIDADNLKVINDTYGHDAGDVYLRAIAELIAGVGTRGCVAARLGGDEFVLFLYGYASAGELEAALQDFKEIQDKKTADLNDEVNVTLKFSFGFGLMKEKDGYQEALREADERMYENKRERKK